MKEEFPTKKALAILDDLVNLNDKLIDRNFRLTNRIDEETRAKMQAIAFIITSGNRKAFEYYCKETESSSTDDFHNCIIQYLWKEMNTLLGLS